MESQARFFSWLRWHGTQVAINFSAWVQRCSNAACTCETCSTRSWRDVQMWDVLHSLSNFVHIMFSVVLMFVGMFTLLLESFCLGQIEDVGSGLRNAIHNDRQLPWNGLLNISRNDPQTQDVLKLMTRSPYVTIDMPAILVVISCWWDRQRILVHRFVELFESLLNPHHDVD